MWVRVSHWIEKVNIEPFISDRTHGYTHCLEILGRDVDSNLLVWLLLIKCDNISYSSPSNTTQQNFKYQNFVLKIYTKIK